MSNAQNFALLCDRTHAKAFIELLCQNKCQKQSESKVVCESGIKLENILYIRGDQKNLINKERAKFVTDQVVPNLNINT